MQDGYGSMQYAMGLESGSMAPDGSPTPMIPPPITKHPGQMSAELVRQHAAATAFAMRDATAPVNYSAGGIFNPAQAALGMGAVGGSPLGAFADGYAQNRENIAARRMGAYGMGVGGMTPMTGFDTTMMPSAAYMSDPRYGAFRPNLAPGGRYPGAPGMAREPLLPPVFYQGLPPARFGTPFDQASEVAVTRAAQYQGALAGAFAYTGLDSVVGKGAKNPFTNLAERTAQVQNISTGFAVSGEQMGAYGRGLDNESAQSLARFVQKNGAAYVEGFNAADFARIVSEGSKAGLLDGRQMTDDRQLSRVVDDTKSKVINLAGTLKKFMKLANEPDVIEALREMGRMKNLGLSLPETVAAAENAKTYARMAGTSVRALAEAGRAGALTFQGIGLSGGLGAQVMQGATGIARQAVASGTYTDAQLAMMGGMSGLAQRQTESTAAILKIPMLAASMSRLGKFGTFDLDSDAIAKFATGQMDIEDMARQGTDNLTAAVSRKGPAAMGMFLSQQNELQDQIGRALGPEGLMMAGLGQVHGTMKKLGMSGAEGFMSAAQLMFKGDPETARAMTMFAANPENFKNLQRHLGVKASEFGTGVYSDIEADQEASRSQASMRYRETFRPLEYKLKDVMSFAESGVNRVNRFFSEGAEDYANRQRGLYTVRYGRPAVVENEAQRRAVDTVSIDDALKMSSSLLGQVGQGQTTANQTFSAPSNVMAYVRQKEGKDNGLALLLRKALSSSESLGNAFREDPAALQKRAESYNESAQFVRGMQDTSLKESEEAWGKLVTAAGGDEEEARRRKAAFVKSLQEEAHANRGGVTGLGVAADVILPTAFGIGGVLKGAGAGAVLGFGVGAVPGAAFGGAMGYANGKLASSGLKYAARAMDSEIFETRGKALSGEAFRRAKNAGGYSDEEYALLSKVIDRGEVVSDNAAALNEIGLGAALAADDAEKVGTAVRDQFQATGTALFGDTGTADEKITGLNMLLMENEGDDRASVVAALEQAIKYGDESQQKAARERLAEYKTKYGGFEHKGSPALRISQNLKASADKAGDVFTRQQAALGYKLASMGSLEEMHGFLSNRGTGVRGFKKGAEITKGSMRLVLDAKDADVGREMQRLLLGAGDSEEGLARLGDYIEGHKDAFRESSGSEASVKKFLKRRAENPTKIADARQELFKDLISQNPMSAVSTESGIASKDIEMQQALVSQMGRLLSSEFPAAVTTFHRTVNTWKETINTVQSAVNTYVAQNPTAKSAPGGQSTAKDVSNTALGIPGR